MPRTGPYSMPVTSSHTAPARTPEPAKPGTPGVPHRLCTITIIRLTLRQPAHLSLQNQARQECRTGSAP